jgi:hypothetical protein
MQGKFDDLEETTAAAVKEILAGWGDAVTNLGTYKSQLSTGLVDSK